MQNVSFRASPVLLPGSTRGRPGWPIETTVADDEELEAGHEVTTYAWNGRWVTDRARMQHELDGIDGDD